MLFPRFATLTLLSVQASLQAEAAALGGKICGKCEPEISPVDDDKHIVEVFPRNKKLTCGECVEDDGKLCREPVAPCAFQFKVFKKNGKKLFETPAAKIVPCGRSLTFGEGVEIDGKLETFAVIMKCGPCDQKLLSKASCGGDPHFQTFHGHKFSFHGECDLVLLHSSKFASGTGLAVHVRTERAGNRYSFVSEAAVRIGQDIFEVTNDGTYYINGMSDATLPTLLAGKFSVTTHTDSSILEHKLRQPFKSQNFTQFDINLENNQNIQMKVWKGMVWVEIIGAHEQLYDSVGLMGMWDKKGKPGRDGIDITDNNIYGQEWQVNDTEPKLFRYSREPQYPNKCLLPKDKYQTARRLDEQELQKKAKNACKEAKVSERDFCIFDVVATGDEEMALAYLV